MAQRVEVTLICDLTGEKAEETIHFGLDGTAYKVDLTKHHADALREILGEYVDVAERVPAATSTRKAAAPRAGAPARPDRAQLQAIRDWARSNGFSVNDRGRIANEVTAAFEAAHAGRPRLAEAG